MTLTTGTRLGPYEIQAAIGAGGMGEVYRAKDTRLDRTVAIKVLAAHIAGDPALKERFEREARAISSLNHPHICTLYDVGQQDAVDYLVLEYLEGETLAERLKKGPIPVERALRFAIQIADALDKAHRQGITHRDLKPGNIFLVGSRGTSKGTEGRARSTAEDTVKLLDFGLAKLRPSPQTALAGLTALATATVPLTGQGTILGTLHYMAPEQLEGKEADARADIFAFGAIVYEMVTGKRAFDGKSAASLIGAILERDPEPLAAVALLAPPGERLRPARGAGGERGEAAPPSASERGWGPASIQALDRVVKTCLAKHPDDRWATAHDVLVQLRWIAEGGMETVSAAAPVAQPPVRRHRIRDAGIIAVMSLALAAAITWFLWPAPAPRHVTRFSVPVPEGQTLTATGGEVVLLSPDGTTLVYVANQRLFLRALDQLEAAPIHGSEESPRGPVFSPDGQWVAYWAAGQLKKIAIGGGAPVALATVASPFGMSWQGDAILVGLNTGGIVRVPATGGTPEPLVKMDEKKGEMARGPQLLPGGKALLFTLRTGGGRWDDGRIVAQVLATGERKVLVEGGADGQYLPTGHLIYARLRVLYAIPFDADRLELRGGPVSVLQDVSEGVVTGAAHFGVSDVGSIAYVRGSPRETRTLVWVDRSGREEPLQAPPRAYNYPRISPDGTRVALDVRDQENDAWIWDLRRQTLTRLTFDPGEDQYALWTPDGKHVVFSSARQGRRSLFWKAADGTGADEELSKSESPRYPQAFSPDGRFLVYREQLAADGDLGVLDLKARQARALVKTQFSEHSGEVSPDGRWIAYQSNESGQNEIYVRPFPDVDKGRWQVSTDGGAAPAWSRRGRELFYVRSTGQHLMAVPVQAGEGFTAGTPQQVFDMAPYFFGPFGRTYDVSPDGKRFLMIKPGGATQGAQFIIIENWFDELKARVPRN